jgi:phosphocarrier protein FPr
VRDLAERGFGDSQPPTPQAAQAAPARGSGLDLAMGPAVVRRRNLDTSAYRPGDAEEETQRSRTAVAAVSARLADLEHQVGGEAGGILAAQRVLLADPEITGAVDADLAGAVSAVTAWQQRLDAVARRFEALEDGSAAAGRRRSQRAGCSAPGADRCIGARRHRGWRPGDPRRG